MPKPRVLLLSITLMMGMSAIPARAGGDRPDNPRAAKLQRLSTNKLLDLVGQESPTMAASLRRQADLRAGLGDDAYHDALAQVAAFAQSGDADCREALRILGDSVERPKAPIGAINIDGRADDWLGIIPNPQTRRWGAETEDRARHVWRHGAASVVRNGQLIAMLGLDNPRSFDWSDSRIRIEIDCAAGPEWDVEVYVSRENDQWHGQARYRDGGCAAGREPNEVRVLNIAAHDVIELTLDTSTFAPPAVAKPIWTLYVNVRTHDSGKTFYPRTRDIPVFNEDAVPGVAADAGTCMLMLLSADAGLAPDDRTAVAIAITSATIFATSDIEVQRQLRKDNAEQLRFARDLTALQRRANTSCCLDQYPLEAQLAWANRCIWLGVRYLGWHVSRDKPADLECYRWAYLPIDTLRSLNELALHENLIHRDAAETAGAIDHWVTAHLKRRMYWGHVLEGLERYTNDPERRGVFDEAYAEIKPLRDSGQTRVGAFKGQEIHQVFARNTETYLRLISEHGCFYGGCPDEAWVGQDLLRAVGMAPLAFHVEVTNPDQTGHCWAGYFNPATGRWHSAQVGRSDDNEWVLGIDRIAVYPYAAMAARADASADNLPYPQFMRKRLVGKDVEVLTQGGIPTTKIRTWMLTPWVAD